MTHYQTALFHHVASGISEILFAVSSKLLSVFSSLSFKQLSFFWDIMTGFGLCSFSKCRFLVRPLLLGLIVALFFIQSHTSQVPLWQPILSPPSMTECWELLLDSVCACVRVRFAWFWQALSGRSLHWSPFYSTSFSISPSTPQPPVARPPGHNPLYERFYSCPGPPYPLSGWPPHSYTLVLFPHWEIIDIAIFNMGFMLRGHYQ